MMFTRAMEELILKENLLGPIEDSILLKDFFEKKGSADDFLYLAYGDTWFRVPSGLKALLAETASMDHGYMMSSWGKPEYRQILQNYIFKEHRLPADCDWRVGFCTTGTRVRMFDFAGYIKNQTQGSHEVIYFVPSWDYEQVFQAQYFKSTTFELSIKDRFTPDVDLLRDHLKKVCSAHKENRHIVLVLNPHHNPTGVSWQENTVREMIELCLEFKTSLLIDDAYYGVVEPEAYRVSALAILYDALKNIQAKNHPLWIQVRSLGKQFHCNGWGTGATTASHEMLVSLDGRYYTHNYSYGAMLQFAMTRWLTSTESSQFLAQLNMEYQKTKIWICDFLVTHTDYPKELLYHSDCSPYYLIKVPNKFLKEPHPGKAFKKEALYLHNLLLGDGNMVPSKAHEENINYSRLYIGAGIEMVQKAMKRLSHYKWT